MTATAPARSFLFVPADSDRKLAKALTLGADVLIFDLEDAVLPAKKPEARTTLAAFLDGYTATAQAWVRVNDLSSSETLRDLLVAVHPKVRGVVLPKILGPECIQQLSHYLDMAETARGLPLGHTRIIAVCTETPAAVLRVGELSRLQQPRLSGLMWGGEDLSAAMGAGDPRLPDGRWRATMVHARHQCLMLAHTLGVEAIDTVFVDFRDPEGCAASAAEARHDGFTGKVAIHPSQVDIINRGFSVTEAERAYAQRVIEAMSQGAGAVALDGKMIDVPHLKQAQRVLARHAAQASSPSESSP